MNQMRGELIVKAEGIAKAMRRRALQMAFAAGVNGSHIGPGLSMIELLAGLFGGILHVDCKEPKWADRDRFILSKGHGVLAYYTALEQAGFLTSEELLTFEHNESILPGHPVMNPEKGIETSSGSLGMGLSLGIGVALAARMANREYLTYVLMGDGECQEGSVWEAAMSAAHYGLGNLIAIIDKNNLQYDGSTDEIMCLGNLADKWRAFGWDASEIDGHSICAIFDALYDKSRGNRPKVVIAHTIKGKGVSFIENRREWHHSRLSKSQYEAAVSEQSV